MRPPIRVTIGPVFVFATLASHAADMRRYSAASFRLKRSGFFIAAIVTTTASRLKIPANVPMGKRDQRRDRCWVGCDDATLAEAQRSAWAAAHLA